MSLPQRSQTDIQGLQVTTPETDLSGLSTPSFQAPSPPPDPADPSRQLHVNRLVRIREAWNVDAVLHKDIKDIKVRHRLHLHFTNPTAWSLQTIEAFERLTELVPNQAERNVHLKAFCKMWYHQCKGRYITQDVKAKPFGKNDVEKDRSVRGEVMKVLQTLDPALEVSKRGEIRGIVVGPTEIPSGNESTVSASPRSKSSLGQTVKHAPEAKKRKLTQHATLDFRTDAQISSERVHKKHKILRIHTADMHEERFAADSTPGLQKDITPSTAKPHALTANIITRLQAIMDTDTPLSIPNDLSASEFEVLQQRLKHFHEAVLEQDNAEERFHETRAASYAVRQLRKPGELERVEREVGEWEVIIERKRAVVLQLGKAVVRILDSEKRD